MSARRDDALIASESISAPLPPARSLLFTGRHGPYFDCRALTVASRHQTLHLISNVESLMFIALEK